MMKKTTTFTFFALASVLIAACTSPTINHKMTGMANPSSLYCVSVGGQSFTKKDTDGNEVGYCRLPDGQAVDAWDFFRKNNPPRNNMPLQ